MAFLCQGKIGNVYLIICKMKIENKVRWAETNEQIETPKKQGSHKRE